MNFEKRVKKLSFQAVFEYSDKKITICIDVFNDPGQYFTAH